MRVMEPVPKRKTARKKQQLNVPVFIGALILIILAGYSFSFHTNPGKRILGIESDNKNTSSSATNGPFRFFSGYDFQSLYELTAYPNTKAPLTEVSITGNIALDTRIRQIAESRGYKKQNLPSQPITDIQVPVQGVLLQPPAFEAAQKLVAQAQADHIPLKIQTSYRSVDEQRDLFMKQLGNLQASLEQIQSGVHDARLTQVLESTPPPGYSRLQTGYAVGLSCGNTSGLFRNSTCYIWLKNNNYAKAKQAGFIPSYSDGVGTPDVKNETEYVWVGTSKLY